MGWLLRQIYVHDGNLFWRWEEALQIDEAIERLVALDALLIFEVRGGRMKLPTY
jgi:hypothetical protein